VSAALVVALALLLTPCCELFAALHQSVAPASAAATHTPHDDDHQLPAGEHCAPWLEQVYMPASTVALPAVDPQGDIDAVAPAAAWPVARMLVLKVVPRAGAPPRLRSVYLLTSRFLL
jgi:hypothetical protein